MIKITIALFLSVLLLWSCNDEFNINSDWQDITIVYGLLNSTDTAHYIKINKAFLGDGDVYEMAKVADSIQYPYALNVTLLEYVLTDIALSPYNPENWKRTSRNPIWLGITNEISKDSGAFGNEVNYLYKTNESLTDGMKYVLEIINPDSTKTVTSETFMVYKLKVIMPLLQSPLKINMANEKNPYKTEWEAAVYGKVYQTAIRFHYLDIIGTDTTLQQLELFYTEQTSNDVREPNDTKGLTMSQRVGGIDFYTQLASNIPVISNVKRIYLNVDFMYYVGGQNFATYLNVSKSSANYGQIENAYTNIKNGKGIFDCRYEYEVPDRVLDVPSIDSLHRGRFTKKLNFVNYTIKYQ